MNESARASLSALRRAAGRAGRRVRLARAIRRASSALPLVLAYAVGALTFIKAARPSLRTERMLLWVGAALALLALSWIAKAFWKRQSAWSGAVELDRHHGLRDRVTNALAFSQLPTSERTPFMDLAIEDAQVKASALNPRAAVPIPIPREFGLVAVLILALVGISKLEVRTVRQLPPPPPPVASLLTEDDIELFRERLEEVKHDAKDAEQLAAIGRYNALLEDVAARRIDREEVFRRLAEIERDLAKDLEADREAMDQGLKSLAQELEKSSLSRKAAEALSERRLKDAEQALRELSQRLQRKTEKPSKAELEKLRQALSKASQANVAHVSDLEQQRAELTAERESLLKKKKENPDAGALDQKLAENQRKLEKLDREKKQAEQAARQLDELDKQLAEAASKLLQEMGDSAKSLEQSAESLNRMAQKDLTSEQKKELLKRLEELRDVLRQQGQGGKDQLERLRRFSERARGKSGPGQGQDGEGEGKPGQGSGKGPPRIGFGHGSGQGMEIPGMGQGAPSDGQNPSSGSEGASAGKGQGQGHDPNVSGDPTSLKGQTHDVAAAAVDTGQGSASAEVIYGAAARGFGSKEYRDIYVQYEGVAEQNIDKDEIPPGYRFYIKRYFQLIRPRD